MPVFDTFKVDGLKVIPANRFNLTPTTTPSVLTEREIAPVTRVDTARIDPADETLVNKTVTTRSIPADGDPVRIIANTRNMPVADDPVRLLDTSRFNLVEIPFLSTIIGTLQPEESYPLIENPAINPSDTFSEYLNPTVKWIFPLIHLTPNDDCLFWYSNETDSMANIVSQTGEIRLKYSLENLLNVKNIPINLVEVKGYFKVLDNGVETWIALDGQIQGSLLVISLKDKMVKVAYNCLRSTDKFKVSLFFQFKGITKVAYPKLQTLNLKPFRYQKLMDESASISAKPAHPVAAVTTTAPVVDPTPVERFSGFKFRNLSDKRLISDLSRSEMTPVHILPVETDEEVYKKQVFVLPATQLVSSSSAPFISGILRKYDKTNGIPFTGINNELDEVRVTTPYSQIFLTSDVVRDVNVYKSNYQPNIFVIVPKNYLLARTSDTKEPCINFNFFATEDGVSNTEDLSKIELNFAISPDISEFEEVIIRRKIIEEGFADGQVSNTADLSISYPSNLGADFQVGGNILFDTLAVLPDGKYFNCNLVLDNLSTAGLLINNIENQIPLLFGINLEYGALKESLSVEVNLMKTVGDLLTREFSNGFLSIKNSSAVCQVLLKSLMVQYQSKEFLLSQLFTGSNKIVPVSGEINIAANQIPTGFDLTQSSFYLDYEIIEAPSGTVILNVTTNSDYYLNLSVEIKKSNSKVKKALLFMQHTTTSTDLRMEVAKVGSKFPPTLFRLFMPVQAQAAGDFVIAYYYGYDKDGNLIFQSPIKQFDYKASAIINL